MPSSITFNTGETAKRFIFAAAQDSADDDGESVKLAFGALPTGVSGGTNTEATVSITDDGPPNSAPIFTDGANTTRNFSETVGNAMETIAHSIGSPISATDADNDTLTYSLECQDASRFAVMSTSGQLRTRAGQNYDHEAGPSLSVRVKVNDGNGGSATINVTMSVTDVTTEAPLRPAAPTVLETSTTSLYVNWNAPNNTGRPAITGYDLRYRISGTWTNGPQNVTATNRAIHGLEPDTSYDVQVTGAERRRPEFLVTLGQREHQNHRGVPEDANRANARALRASMQVERDIHVLAGRTRLPKPAEPPRMAGGRAPHQRRCGHHFDRLPGSRR